MKRRNNRKMGLVLGIIGLILSVVIIYFSMPNSRLKASFRDYLVESEKNTRMYNKDNKYTMENLPQCIKNFYNYSGLIDKINIKHISFDFKDAKFANIEMKKNLKIDYSEHIFGNVPARFAFIDSALFGIPFQGLDSYFEGKGGMKGVIAKNITIFNEKGNEMDKATLVTWLSEAIFIPSELLNGNIKLKEIDRNTINASVTYDSITVSGIYKFLDNGELIEFITDDRAISNNGSFKYRRWSALFEEYKNKDDLLLPNRLKAKWHFDDEDIIYFDGANVEYKFYE